MILQSLLIVWMERLITMQLLYNKKLIQTNNDRQIAGY